MATTISITCPECDKQIKAPADLEGKKIRCKGCGHVFVVKAGLGGVRAADPDAGKKKPEKAAKKPEKKDAKPKAGQPKPLDPEDDADPNPYGVTDLDSAPRCPDCANEMESRDAILCLHCGYNTLTRTRATTRKTVERTTGDWIVWLLPGILCVLLILTLIGIDLFYVLFINKLVEDNAIFFWLAYGGIKLWMVIVSVFIMFFAGRFALKRLVFNPVPPEKETK